MAILLVKIEDKNSLAFNEFFDYNGCCYASTRSRENPDSKVIDMVDFFDAAINTETLYNIPVVFVSEENGSATVLGWYRSAEISNEMHILSFFLEGNIKAYANDCIWLPDDAKNFTLKWFARGQFYEVIEEEDARFKNLEQMIDNYQGNNRLIRYHQASVHTLPAALKNASLCESACKQWADLVSNGKCQDIRDIKTLESYAKALSEKSPSDSDGYYYLALSQYHLGFVKDGLKSINKALKIEPEASDLIALKGLLLVSKGYALEGAAHLHSAFEKSQYEVYLQMEGRAYMMAGNAVKAYDCFKHIKDEKLLSEANARLKEMERKIGSIRMGYMKIKDLLKKI